MGYESQTYSNSSNNCGYTQNLWEEALKSFGTWSGWKRLLSEKTKAVNPVRGWLLTAAGVKECVCKKRAARKGVCVRVSARLLLFWSDLGVTWFFSRVCVWSFCHMLLLHTHTLLLLFSLPLTHARTRTHTRTHPVASAADCKQGGKWTKMRRS